MKANPYASLSDRRHLSLLAFATAGMLWVGATSAPAQQPCDGKSEPAATQPAPADLPQAVKVFQLKNANAKSLARAVQGVFSPRGCRVTEDESSNAVIVSGSPQALEKVEVLIAQLDSDAMVQTQRGLPDVRVFDLKYARAQDISEIISKVVGGLNCAVQPGANAFIVGGYPEKLKGVEDLVKRLDRETPEPVNTGIKTRIFQLKYGPDEAMQKALEAVLAAATNIRYPGQQQFNRFSMDAPRHTVVVTGTDEALQAAEQIINGLDEPPPPPEATEVTGARVRIVWLVAGGVSMGASTAPPPDMREVIEELARIGVADLSLVAQTVVQAMPDQKFSTRCSFTLDNPIDLSIRGVLTDLPSGIPCLELSLNGKETVTRKIDAGGPGPQSTTAEVKDICTLETTVVAEPGHAIVLGVTPIGTATSVFVVQVMPEKTTVKRSPLPPSALPKAMPLPPPGLPRPPQGPPAPPRGR